MQKRLQKCRQKMCFWDGASRADDDRELLPSYLREGTLFLNLSEQAIMNFSPDVNLQNSYELLQMNVKANFPSVKKIELFIDGKSVFLDDKIQTKNN